MPMTRRCKTGLSAGLALVLLWLSITPSAAQTNTNIRISPPDTEDFPTISFLLSATTVEGARMRGLSDQSIDILEDGITRQPSSVAEVSVGTRQLFVINSTEAMAVRDSRGRTRFHFVREALLGWWSSAEAAAYGADDLTLVTGDGPLIEHSAATASLAAHLDQHQPSFAPNDSGIGLLLNSLAYLDDSSGGDRPAFVVFATSQLAETQSLALTNTIARANELGAVVYPVLIAAADLEQEALQPLQQLADSTGGELIRLDPAEAELSELSQRILSQRTQYQVRYQSGLARSGVHEIRARVNTGGQLAQSEPRQLTVDIAPPQVTLVQPPDSITRASEDPALSIAQLPPTETQLQIVVSFPDGHPRPLRFTRLEVDGEAVAFNQSEPFDLFSWDLSAIRQSGTVELQAVAEDDLGLQTRSLIHTVDVTVVPPPGGLRALQPALGSIAVIVVVLSLGSLAALALLNTRRQAAPPPAQPGPRPVRTLNRPRLQSPNPERVEAYLLPVLDEAHTGEPIYLTGVDLSLGRDASLAAVALDDASVSGLHARLIRQAGGEYLLRDQGSTAGTWVNFDPIPDQGRRLRHGDVIQLGRVSLRFQRPGAPPPKINRQPLDEGSNSVNRARRSRETDR